NLVLALKALPVARRLPSHHGETNLSRDLARLSDHVDTSHFDLERISPLFEAVLRKETDTIIWGEVYKLVAD
ncbi:hypothetical protein K505DRAFT_195814, partial [Melanomma pulvis-pyrius CBS 109.77]